MTGDVIWLAGVAVGMALLGLLVVWLGRACERGTLRRNGLVGIRTPDTMASDAAWLAGHQAAAPRTKAGGTIWCLVCVLAAACSLLQLAAVGTVAVERIVVALLIVGVIGGCVVLFTALPSANRAAREALAAEKAAAAGCQSAR